MRWSRDLVMDVEISRNLSGNPAIAGDLVLVSSPVSRRIFAFRLADGRALWQRALFARHRGSITIFHGLALVAEQDGSIEAFDVLSGEQRGRCSWGSPATPFAPLVVGNTFLYGGSDGVLRALPVDVLLTSFGSLPGASCVH